MLRGGPKPELTSRACPPLKAGVPQLPTVASKRLHRVLPSSGNWAMAPCRLVHRNSRPPAWLAALA
jgi:hypothetical protein